MIRSITVTNSSGESVSLVLRSPEQSGFFVKGVAGLGPVKATINTRDSGNIDGTYFNSARAQQRNIVFTLGFLEQPTIEDVRQSSYRYFPLKDRVEIMVETDNKDVRTYGYVESNEPDIFSSQETTVISIVCPDPYFYSTLSSMLFFSAVQDAFQFPFSNESLTENLIVMGNILSDTTQSLEYFGEVPVGFVIRVDITGPVNNFKIYDLITGEFISIASSQIVLLTGLDLKSGDQLIISTVRGNKYAYLYRDGQTYNIINAITSTSSWLQIRKGINSFYYTADSGITNIQIEFEYLSLYEGV